MIAEVERYKKFVETLDEKEIIASRDICYDTWRGEWFCKVVIKRMMDVEGNSDMPEEVFAKLDEMFGADFYYNPETGYYEVFVFGRSVDELINRIKVIVEVLQ